ncbi:MAG: hypothetical protein ACOVNY_06705 [Chitinophagaceae bacterium]
MYFIRFVFIIGSFIIRLLKNKYTATKHAQSLIAAISKENEGKLDDFTYNKIVSSHNLYITIMFDAFVRLRGRNTSLKEKTRSIHYFICSSLFDNFWDNKSHTLEELSQMSFNTQHYQPKNFDDTVFVQSHLFLLDEVNDKAGYVDVSHKVFNAQAASLQQFNPNITNEQIQAITFAKGGNSVLLCKYYLDIQSSQEESECWFLIGTLIQLGNDLFDIYKDSQQQIQTLGTRCTNAYELEKIYLQQVRKIQALIKKMPFPTFRKTEFSVSLAATYTLGMVALHQLKQTQGKNNQLPNLQTVERKALIVDMQKVRNLLRWLTFIYKEAKL